VNIDDVVRIKVTATMADVAREAGVSASTVSRVFSVPESVRQDTRQRVLAVAGRLDFTPNRAASALARCRTQTLGLLVPNVVNPYYAEIVKAVQQPARAKDHALFLADTGDPALTALHVPGRRDERQGGGPAAAADRGPRRRAPARRAADQPGGTRLDRTAPRRVSTMIVVAL
jgi:hypothetical protein